MRIYRYLDEVSAVPVDFLADPDGEWEFESLVEAAGFDPTADGVTVGALSQTYRGHSDGCAVVVKEGSNYLAVVDCVPQPVVWICRQQLRNQQLRKSPRSALRPRSSHPVRRGRPFKETSDEASQRNSRRQRTSAPRLPKLELLMSLTLS
jgi:hypothetical protein